MNRIKLPSEVVAAEEEIRRNILGGYDRDRLLVINNREIIKEQPMVVHGRGGPTLRGVENTLNLGIILVFVLIGSFGGFFLLFSHMLIASTKGMAGF